MLTAAYTQGADLPDLTLEWRDSDGSLLPFATGWTFQLKLGTPGSAAALTKTTGITPADTSPNVTIAWPTSAELNTLTPGYYHAELTATRASDSKQRKMAFGIRLDPQIT